MFQSVQHNGNDLGAVSRNYHPACDFDECLWQVLTGLRSFFEEKVVPSGFLLFI